MRKVSFIKVLGACSAALVFAGCASTQEGQPPAVAAKSIEVQQICHPSPAMKRMNVNLVIYDKRPQQVRRRYGAATIQRPELYYERTIDLKGYMVEYLKNAGFFKSIKAAPKTARGEYEFRMNWLNSQVHINGWIPFVIRFQNHMTIQMELIGPGKKVLWSGLLNNHVVNTPSIFRVVHRHDLFQQRLMERELPKVLGALCNTVK